VSHKLTVGLFLAITLCLNGRESKNNLCWLETSSPFPEISVIFYDVAARSSLPMTVSAWCHNRPAVLLHYTRLLLVHMRQQVLLCLMLLRGFCVCTFIQLVCSKAATSAVCWCIHGLFSILGVTLTVNNAPDYRANRLTD